MSTLQDEHAALVGHVDAHDQRIAAVEEFVAKLERAAMTPAKPPVEPKAEEAK